MTIQRLLKEIGLNDKEAKIYLTLLKHGKVLPAILSKLTGINRATVYAIANNLASLGIIAEDLSGKTLYLTPLPPAHLEQLIEKQKRELKQKEAFVQEAIDKLSVITAEKEYPVPKIRFVQENDLKDFLYDNARKWQKSILKNDGVWWGFQDHSFVECYKDWIHFTWTTPEGKNLKLEGKVLSNISEIEKRLTDKHIRRDMRVLPDMKFTSTMWVAGDYLVMIMTEHNPFYLFEIHDIVLAHNIREVFKKLWGSTQQ